MYNREPSSELVKNLYVPDLSSCKGPLNRSANLSPPVRFGTFKLISGTIALAYGFNLANVSIAAFGGTVAKRSTLMPLAAADGLVGLPVRCAGNSNSNGSTRT